MDIQSLLLKDSAGNIENVKICDILYYLTPKKITMIRTDVDLYKHKNKDVYIPDILSRSDYFISADRETFVNKNKIKKYNSFLAMIYFSENIADSNMALRVTVKSIPNFRRILGKENDTHEEVEYFPLNLRKLRTVE